MKSIILQTYLYLSVHISLCAVCLYVGASDLLGSSPRLYEILLVYAGTSLVYTSHRWLSKDKMALYDSRYTYSQRHARWLLIVMCISFIVAAMSYLWLPPVLKVAYLISGGLCCAYVLPLLYGKRLRDHGVLKLIIIGITWAMIPILPILRQGLDGSHGLASLLYIEHFAFIVSLTIPFELRDALLDQQTSTKNISQYYSLSIIYRTMTLGIIVALITSTLLWYQGTYTTALLMMNITFYAAQYALTRDLKKVRSETFYLLWLDGLIMIKGVLLLLGAMYAT